MNKSFFYSTVIALTLGVTVAPSVVMAQTIASAQQPAVSLADLQAAISSETPDTAQIQALTASLLAQNPDNMAAIQALAANASPEVKKAINAGIEATGAIDGGRSAPASTGTPNSGAVGGGGSGGSSPN